jgi:hypothetical protein
MSKKGLLSCSFRFPIVAFVEKCGFEFMCRKLSENQTIKLGVVDINLRKRYFNFSNRNSKTILCGNI